MSAAFRISTPVWQTLPIEPSPAEHFDDEKLIAAVAQGDKEAFGVAFQRFGSVCVSLARRILRDHHAADDVVNEVFVRLWNEPTRFDANRGSLRTFLLTQVHSRCVDVIRADTSRKSRESAVGAEFPVTQQSVESELEKIVTAEQVHQALLTLSEEERSAITRAYFDGQTYREVAESLQIPEGTAKSRIRSGMSKLRDVFHKSEVHIDG